MKTKMFLKSSISKQLNFGNDFIHSDFLPLTSFILNEKEIDVHKLIHDEWQMDQFSQFESDALQITKNWNLGQQKFTIKTSGSTGKPKALVFSREQMIRSAQRTLKTFDLKPGDKILACLNPRFIAGTMMLIRAIEGDLSLTIQSPDAISQDKLDSNYSMDFVSFTPNQIEHILRTSPKKLSKFKKIVIGGAGLHPEVEEKLKDVKSEIYHSYAMTETLTHTALRRISHHENSMVFHALEGVRYNVDTRSCLVIDDDWLDIEGLVTNDVVELVDESSFIWKGRFDNVINSGGIKIQIEDTELMVTTILKEMHITNPFCLLAKADPSLTSKLVMLIEGNQHQPDTEALHQKLKERLPQYHAPKELIVVPEIFLTDSGKINRQKNIERYTI